MLEISSEIHQRAFSCQGMVRSLAWQLKRKLPDNVEMDELVSEGQVGLMRAARDYDAGKGAAFPTYAYWRIRGSMQDWVRKQHWYDLADFHSGALTEYAEEEINSEVPAAITSALSTEVEDVKASDPAVEASENEVKQVLRGLIDRLEGLPRQILDATLLKSQTLEEAGMAVGVHKGTAQRAQVRGFEQLAEAIRARGLGDLEGEELRQLVFKRAPGRKST